MIKNEPLFGQFDIAYDVSKEAQLAQRMAELEQMAKYRAQKIQLYKEWSKDSAAAAEKIQALRQAAGDAIVKDQEGFKPYDFKGFAEKTTQREIHHHAPAKKSLLARLGKWLRGR